MTVWGRAAKAIQKVVMSWVGGSRSWSLALLGRTSFDYAAEVASNGLGNSAVVACVRWIGRTFPEAPLQVLQVNRDGTETAMPGHALTKLLSRPNAFYSGELLWRATLSDWTTVGNAYWLKVRNGYREPVELWWLPQHLVTPVWPQDGSAYLSGYEYNPNGTVITYSPQDIVHFRDGMDPNNTRLGLSPLASMVREIFTDDEAANFTASILRNMGIPGVVIAPDTDEVHVSQEDADAIKAKFKQLTGADHRGDPLVMPARVKVTPLSFNPQQMDVKALRRLPEERVSAVLGVPAIVAGLGAGLDRSTFANMAEAREAAYESNIIPNQRLFAGELGAQLLTEWDASGNQRVAFDYRQVRVLQEDQNKLWVRVDVAVRGGWLKVGRGKELVGEKPEPGDDVYLRSSSVAEVGPDAREPEPVDQVDGSDGVDLSDQGAKGRRAEKKGSRERLLARLGRDWTRLTGQLAGELDGAFEALAAGLVIRVDGARKGDGMTTEPQRTQSPQRTRETKDALSITLAGGELVQVEIPPDVDATFQKLYEAAFVMVLQSTVESITETLALNVGVNLDDPAAREMIRGWATRQGLADIAAQTREAIMAALADGRAAGDGAEDLARRIRGMVEGRAMYPGVYRDAYERARARGWGDAAASRYGDRIARQYRSETIARTETKIAQNKSSIAAYRSSEWVTGLLVFDGDDCGWRSHTDAEKAHGKTVTFDEAEMYPLAHPRCVRSFAPVVEEP